MPESWTHQCWDSGLLISFLTRKEQAKVDMMRQLITAFERGQLDVVISTAVIAEIRPYSEAETDENGNRTVKRVYRHDVAHEAIIADLLDNDRLDIRPVTPAIAEAAADIGNQHPDLLPMDCIHIATALAAGCDVLFTWDGVSKRRKPGDMLRYDGKIGVPALAIKEPFNPKPELDLSEQPS